MRLQPRRPVLLLAALLGAVVLVSSLQHGALAPKSVTAAGSGPEMELTVRDGGFCVDDECYAEVGENFQLSVDVVTAPAATYIMFQTYIDFGGTFDWGGEEDGAGPGTCIDGLENGSPPDGKDYQDSDCTAVEIAYVPGPLLGEVTWPDVNSSIVVRHPYLHSYATHGAASGLMPPLPQSTWEGEVLSLQMSCPAAPAQATISLLPNGNPFIGTLGAMFMDPDWVQITAKTNTITMNCVAPQAEPGDTDGDGCSDAVENGSDPLLGGDRDWLNPWDFYDVAIAGGLPGQDGVIDLPNDYMAVSSHFAPSGGPPYDIQYDRGTWGPGGSWNNTQGPDGVIDLPNDILGVIQQLGHSCN